MSSGPDSLAEVAPHLLAGFGDVGFGNGYPLPETPQGSRLEGRTVFQEFPKHRFSLRKLLVRNPTNQIQEFAARHHSSTPSMPRRRDVYNGHGRTLLENRSGLGPYAALEELPIALGHPTTSCP